jgi:hypothetical protein
MRIQFGGGVVVIKYQETLLIWNRNWESLKEKKNRYCAGVLSCQKQLSRDYNAVQFTSNMVDRLGKNIIYLLVY